mmetsp:Transcript_45465/g.146350  ORF Transcript_45465/g.146350 Transcript_45465/m.146350 type:complete len:294 (+) Transcript_45465:628-1509(+)
MPVRPHHAAGGVVGEALVPLAVQQRRACCPRCRVARLELRQHLANFLQICRRRRGASGRASGESKEPRLDGADGQQRAQRRRRRGGGRGRRGVAEAPAHEAGEGGGEVGRALPHEHVPARQKRRLECSRRHRRRHRRLVVAQLCLRVEAEVPPDLREAARPLVAPAPPHREPAQQPADRGAVHTLCGGRRGRRLPLLPPADASACGRRRADVAAREDESGRGEGGEQRPVVLPPSAGDEGEDGVPRGRVGGARRAHVEVVVVDEGRVGEEVLLGEGGEEGLSAREAEERRADG